MAFESLTDKLQNVFKNLRSKGRLTEADVKAALKEMGFDCGDCRLPLCEISKEALVKLRKYI